MKVQACIGFVVAALLAFPGSAGAAPDPAEGTISQLSYVVANTEIAGGGSTIVYFNEMNSLTGPIAGVTALHGACKTQSSGRTSCRAEGAFAGTVDGRTGSFYFTQSTTVDPVTGAYSGRVGIRGGSGDLAGLRGHGTVQGVGNLGRYSLALSL